MAPNSHPSSSSQERLAELVELERTLIPVINRVRKELGKPKIIVPKPGEQWILERVDRVT